jgi:UDP-N-acetylglucosamine 2-epimerase (non-hydrolysing)
MKTVILLFIFCCQLSADPIQPILLMIGTRPEAIKMAPVYQALKAEGFPTLLCSSGQHEELLNEVLELFEIKQDFAFKIMKPGQDLFHITQSVLEQSKELFQKLHPCMVIVQGDTTTAMAAALAAFYLKIPIAHVEAGLRSGNRDRPFPEEINRKMMALLSSYHFAPTQRAKNALLKEGISEDFVYCTGNTVVDALFAIQQKLKTRQLVPTEEIRSFIEQQQNEHRKTILLTAHRRESFDSGLHHIFSAVKSALEKFPELSVIYPIHPNPAIETVLKNIHLDQSPRIKITKPLAYKDLVWLLGSVDGVATDSGGIQEEAFCMKKFTLVLREETDRPETIENGMGFLVGTNEEKITAGIGHVLAHSDLPISNHIIYGDGRAAWRIAQILKPILMRNDE